MAGASDQYKRVDLTLVDNYAPAGSEVTFDGPMNSFLFSNTHATAMVFVSWMDKGEDAIAVRPGTTVTVQRPVKVRGLKVRRETGAAFGPVYMDISATGVGQFYC